MFRFRKTATDAVKTYEVHAEWIGREGNGRTALVAALGEHDALETVFADPGRWLHTITEPDYVAVTLAA